jgi:hypothetical protein
MTREIIMFVLHVLAIVALLFIIDYKRPDEVSWVNWSRKEILITFVILLIALTVLKIK